jgi:hypothetical protein
MSASLIIFGVEPWRHGGEDPYHITSDQRNVAGVRLIAAWVRGGRLWEGRASTRGGGEALMKLDYIATCILVCPSAHKTGAPVIT